MPLLFKHVSPDQLKTFAKQLHRLAPPSAQGLTLSQTQEWTAQAMGHADFHAAQLAQSSAGRNDAPAVDPLVQFQTALGAALDALDWSFTFRDRPLSTAELVDPQGFLPLFLQTLGNGQGVLKTPLPEPAARFQPAPGVGVCGVTIRWNSSVAPETLVLYLLTDLAPVLLFEGGTVALDGDFEALRSVMFPGKPSRTRVRQRP